MVKKSMNEKAIILSSSIRRDVDAIDRIYSALESHTTPSGALSDTDEESIRQKEAFYASKNRRTRR